MLLKTESGSGGSRDGVKTGFDDPADDGGDYPRRLGEVRKKIEELDIALALGENTLRGLANRPGVNLLAGLAISLDLDLPVPSKFINFQTPISEPVEGGGRYN